MKRMQESRLAKEIYRANVDCNIGREWPLRAFSDYNQNDFKYCVCVRIEKSKRDV